MLHTGKTFSVSGAAVGPVEAGRVGVYSRSILVVRQEEVDYLCAVIVLVLYDARVEATNDVGMSESFVGCGHTPGGEISGQREAEFGHEYDLYLQLL